MKGHLSGSILESLLDAIPLDLTVIDANDRIVGWNRHENRMFKRRESVLGKNVRACHREESLPLIESILTRLKSGAMDKAEFWLEKDSGNGREPLEIWVVYWALRDGDGQYLGCMETTQVVHRNKAGVDR